MAFLWNTKELAVAPPAILSSKVAKDIAQTVIDANLTGDALIKITRQLDFWYTENILSDNELVALANRLTNATAVSSCHEDFQCPKVRYGKTEIQMPLITTGGMRIQWTWLPDFKPFTMFHPSNAKLYKSASQENLKIVIRRCMKMGLNHFETARFYGTSEHQFAVALKEMMDAGEFKREDFTFQTKIIPATKSDFMKRWDESWAHICDRLGYIDLFAFHVSSSEQSFNNIFGEEKLMDIAKQWKKEGKIRNIGFSSHGSASIIAKHIETNEFDYCNIHCHYFGSYHAEGTPNPNGGTGNEANVKRALELDMGVFNISPIDKGGMLQNPSATVARTIGHKISPIAFSLLTNWKLGFHTSSVGFGRPTDMDEAIDGASLYADEEMKTEFEAALQRLEALKKEKLGEEWIEKGYLGIADLYDECTGGTAIQHILWLHNVVTAFGMYKFAKIRYSNLEKTRASFKPKKSFEENIKAMNDNNPGLSYDPNFDYTQALSKHYNPTLALEKMKEAHSWLNKDTKFTDEELLKRGWNCAYDLQTWEIFPGAEPTIPQVLLQNLTGGRYGLTDKHPDDRKKWMTTVESTKDAYKKALA